MKKLIKIWNKIKPVAVKELTHGLLVWHIVAALTLLAIIL